MFLLKTPSLQGYSLHFVFCQGGSGLRINGEYFGPNGGSIQGSIRRDTRGGGDFFRGVMSRGDVDASFDARLPSGAGIGGRGRMRRRLTAGLTGISGGVDGRFEGGVRDRFGNHFGGDFQGGFGGRVRVPVIATGFVAGPHLHREGKDVERTREYAFHTFYMKCDSKWWNVHLSCSTYTSLSKILYLDLE